MKNKKTLIIQLLIQNMKNEQLLAALGSRGFDAAPHTLDLSGMVCRLMGTPEENMSIDWFKLYMAYLKKAAALPLGGSCEGFISLAEECYAELVAMPR